MKNKGMQNFIYKSDRNIVIVFINFMIINIQEPSVACIMSTNGKECHQEEASHESHH
jgi:hypothetical protein